MAVTSKKQKGEKRIPQAKQVFASNLNSRVKAVPRHIRFQTTHVLTWLRLLPQDLRVWREEDKKKRKYRSFRLQKRIRPTAPPIPTAWRLCKETFVFLWRNKFIFGGIAAVHAIIYIVLLYSAHATVDIKELKSVVDQTFQGESTNSTVRTATLLGAVLGSPRDGGTNVTLTAVIVIAVSLVYVWTARERTNGVIVKVRDAYYQALGPFVAVLCLLVVMSIQLIPFAIATYFYTTARTNSLFASGAEDLAFFVLMTLCGLLSLYFITSSIIALFIATIPGMYPLKALAAAKKLVQFRRLAIFKRMLAFPVFTGLAYLVLLLGIIRFIPDTTYIFMDAFNILLVPIASIYFYKLYRSLL